MTAPPKTRCKGGAGRADRLHGRDEAQAEVTKAAQRAGIEHTKANDEHAYLGRKPSYDRKQFERVRALLGKSTLGPAAIAKAAGLSRQTVYRIKDDPAGAEAILTAWGMWARTT